MAEPHELWVFAYGSLMWRPGFASEEVAHAKLVGWRRTFCIYSRFHRGSPQRPGLVLGLDRGGVCEGLAYRVAPANVAATLAYLRDREQVVSVYREALVPVTLMTPERPEVLALTYLVERAHPSYAGALTLREQAHLIRGAAGRSGNNIDYLLSTLAHLGELGIRERVLERLLALVGSHLAHGAPGTPGVTRPNAVALLQEHRKRPVRARPFRPANARRFCYRTVLSAV